MNHLFSKTIIAACILAGSAGLANAAVVNAQTQSADITFSNSSGITITLTPTAGLAAGKIADNVALANGNISSANGIPYVFAMRYTPNINLVRNSSEPYRAIISGKHDEKNNKLNVILFGMNVGKGNGWMITNTPLLNQPLYIRSDGEQNINADTYTLSVDGAEWTN